jgi:amino-acid N-acetyltransferase
MLIPAAIEVSSTIRQKSHVKNSMGTTIHLDRFSLYDKEKVLALLNGVELPIEDLTEEKMKNFFVARDSDDRIIGVVGVELYQEWGLLRSLVVHPAFRGTGLGIRLTHKIESFARHNGIKTLYLLTMTAADFFQKTGYEVTQRDRVPESIRQTQEFKHMCPVSAVCLCKRLDPVLSRIS